MKMNSTGNKNSCIGIARRLAAARAAACVVLVLALTTLPAAGEQQSGAGIGQATEAVQRQRSVISVELAKAKEEARLKRQKELAKAQEELSPAGLLIATPPGPEGGELFTVQAKEVAFRDVVVCLARKGRFDLVIDSTVGDGFLEEPMNIDLRLLALEDIIDVLTGMVGLSYRTGPEADGSLRVLIFKDDPAGRDDALHSRRRSAIDVYTRLLLKYPDDDLSIAAYFNVAEIRFDEGEYALASQDYKVLLDRDDGWKFAGPSLLKLGRCYSKLGDYPAASRALYAFLDRGPDADKAAEALLALARAADKAGSPNEAIRVYRRLLIEYPSARGSEQALHELADLLFKEEDYTSALRQYELLRKSRPKYKPRTIRHQVARARMQLEQWSPAASELTKLLSVSKRDAIASQSYYDLAFCLDKSGGRLEALEAYTGAAERFPADPAATKARVRVVQLYRELGLLEKATAYAKGALKMAPPGTPPERALKYQLAITLLQMEQNDMAMVLFEEVAQAPGEAPRADAFIRAAEAARKLAKLGRAEALYRGALAADPNSTERHRALLGLGDTYAALGDYEKAALAYQGKDPSEKKQ
ncbi:MAG: tetratricopeptide repeat protein [Planctomycetes bacterium]|nr:tetratricopeptide repeat protein [Planctomycetota bacterium]